MSYKGPSQRLKILERRSKYLKEQYIKPNRTDKSFMKDEFQSLDWAISFIRPRLKEIGAGEEYDHNRTTKDVSDVQ